MAKESFRRQLKQEAEQWQRENLISAELFEQLSERYEFASLPRSGQVFSTILYYLGGILIGLGVITFVAANWQYLDRWTKVILLMTWLVTVNSLGFYLWQYNLKFQKLGQGLLLLGNLSLGATIALIAQIFNLSGPTYGLFLTWSVGVIAMGAFLRFQTLSMLGLILMTIGYLSYTSSYMPEFNLIADGMPYLSIILTPLAYWLESRAVFALISLLWLTSLAEIVWDMNRILSFVLPATILWGYNDTLKIDRLGSYLSTKPMQPIGRTISLLLFSLGLYVYSFRYSWGEYSPDFEQNPIGQLYFGLMLGVSLYVIISQLFLTRDNLMGKIYMGIITVFALLGLLNIEPIFSIFVTNCLLAVFSFGLIRIAIENSNRRNFWFGMILLCLQIMSRVFEYDTDLLVKAFTLALGGIAVLVMGIWFESHLNKSAEVNS